MCLLHCTTNSSLRGSIVGHWSTTAASRATSSWPSADAAAGVAREDYSRSPTLASHARRVAAARVRGRTPRGRRGPIRRRPRPRLEVPAARLPPGSRTGTAPARRERGTCRPALAPADWEPRLSPATQEGNYSRSDFTPMISRRLLPRSARRIRPMHRGTRVAPY